MVFTSPPLIIVQNLLWASGCLPESKLYAVFMNAVNLSSDFSAQINTWEQRGTSFLVKEKISKCMQWNECEAMNQIWVVSKLSKLEDYLHGLILIFEMKVICQFVRTTRLISLVPHQPLPTQRIFTHGVTLKAFRSGVEMKIKRQPKLILNNEKWDQRVLIVLKSIGVDNQLGLI